MDRRRHGELTQRSPSNTRFEGSRPFWDGSPFVTCRKHNGRAYLREPFIGNAVYRSPICKRGGFRLPLRCAANVRPR